MEWMNQQKESGMEASNAKRQFINLLMNGASVGAGMKRKGEERSGPPKAFPQQVNEIKDELNCGGAYGAGRAGR